MRECEDKRNCNNISSRQIFSKTLVTPIPNRIMQHSMRAFGHIFLFLLMATSLLATTTVHAQEFPGAEAVDCSGFVHSEGDADESQGDADKGIPHHHASCHSAAAFVPQVSDNLLAVRPIKAVKPSFDAANVDRWSIGPDLRPPIA